MAMNKLQVTKNGVLCGTFETGKNIAEFKEEFFPGEDVEITWVGGDIPPSKEVPGVTDEPAPTEPAPTEPAPTEPAPTEPEGTAGEDTTEAPPAE